MKKYFIILLVCIVAGSSQGQTANLTVKVKNIKEVKGSMSVALFNSAEGYPCGDSFYQAKSHALDSLSFSMVFSDIPLGIYAVAVFQDTNDNGEQDTNWLGIPKEPYGFSNDAVARIAAPDFDDAKFEVKEDIEIVVSLVN